MQKLMGWTLLALFLSCPWVPGQSPFADFPFGSNSSVSPDGSFTIYMKNCPSGSNCSRMLWLVNNRTQQQNLLMNIERTIRIGWAPAGIAFFLNDDVSSSGASARPYIPAENRNFDIGDLLDQKFPKDRHFKENSHHYINGLRWINKDEILVRQNGHFDRPMAGGNEFAVCYRISVTGKAVRLSEAHQESSPCHNGPDMEAGFP